MKARKLKKLVSHSPTGWLAIGLSKVLAWLARWF